MSVHAVARLNVVLAAVGLFIAGMLSLSHLLGIDLPCGVQSGCDLVTRNPRSYVLGLPIAYLGFGAYTVIAVVAALRLYAGERQAARLHTLGYVLSGIGLLVSIALTLFSIRVLHAVCNWCIGSAVTMSLLFASHALGSLAKGKWEWPPLVVDAGLPFVLAGIVLLGLFGTAGSLSAKANRVDVDPILLEDVGAAELAPKGLHVLRGRKPIATLVMFADLTCPTCARVFGRLTAWHETRGDFDLAFRHLPLRTHPDARPAALLSEMAAERGKFWPFVTEAYTSAFGSFDDLFPLAARLGVPEHEARRRLNDGRDRTTRLLDRDAKTTQRLDLHSTPTLFLISPGYYPEPLASSGVPEMLDNLHAELRAEAAEKARKKSRKAKPARAKAR